MNYEVIVQEEAAVDIELAFQWYEDKKTGLGHQLIMEIEKCLNQIARNPENYTFITRQYRRIKTSRFPYLLIYYVEVKTVIVVSVLHARQKLRR